MNCDYCIITIGRIDQGHILWEEEGLSAATLTISYKAIPKKICYHNKTNVRISLHSMRE